MDLLYFKISIADQCKPMGIATVNLSLKVLVIVVDLN